MAEGLRVPSRPSSPIVLLHDVTAAPRAPPALRDKPETIRVITRDLIRELIIPRDRPQASLIIGTEEFQRIQEEARAPRRELADRLRILKSRQDAAFISGPSSAIVQLRDVRSAPGTVPSSRDKPKTIRVFTKDVVRELIVPRDRLPASLIIGTEEFQRIQEEARAPRRELADRLRILKSRQDAAFEERSRARRAEQRQEELREAQARSELEQEQERERRELLERAAGMRMEQEDEMRHLNSLLLSARCSSILDRQLAEKRQVQGELRAEEQRLARLMDSQREKELQLQEELERRRKQELISAKREVLQQIEQRQEQRALRAEQKFQEGQRFLEHLEQMRREDREAWQQQQQRKRQLLADMKAVDAENQRLRQRNSERERRAELRALEEQRQQGVRGHVPVLVPLSPCRCPQERDAALETERARLRRERQRELDRVKAMQEHERDWQEAREAVRCRRSQEAAERAWRQRELQRERRRAEQLQELQRGRREQVTQRRQQLALALQQERRDFLTLLRWVAPRLARRQPGRWGHVGVAPRAVPGVAVSLCHPAGSGDTSVTQQQQQLARQRAQRAHAEALREQIRESRQRRQRDRAAAIEEGQRELARARQRAERLARAGQQKLQRLRDSGVPDRFCALVEKRAWGTASAATS
uniref:cilia- and flagella-associated protein 45-like n=1 Tax=Lonchura striata TaxID=40157 RepID=UPI0012934137|nr:cilia- and flagella-associated protein 45-like [Lonchura striata domestica]